MTKLKRVVALALVMLLALSTVPTIFVRAEYGKGYPGETAKVKFVVEDAISLDGEVQVTAGSEIVDSIDCAVVNRGGLKGGLVTGNLVFLYSTASNPTPGDVTIEVTVNLKESAEAGSQCTVTLYYYKSEDPTGTEMNAKAEKSEVVTVQAKAAPTTPTTEPQETTAPTTETTKPSTNTNTNTKPGTTTNNNSGNNTSTNTNTNTNTNSNSTTTNNNNTNSTNPTTATEAKVNYDELKKQIGIAKGLKEADYEEALWEELTEALEEAEKLTSSEDQDKVDAAAKKLSEAITKLVGVDRTKLREALDQVAEYSQDLPLSSLWYQMIGVLENAEKQLESNDQAAVDAAAAQIESLLDEIAKAEQEAGPGTVIQEVPVEVAPTDDFCNITIHNVWPVLFFISLALNIAMAAVIVIYVVRVLKSRKDDTPLVDYDIDDDLDLGEVDLDEVDFDEVDLDDEELDLENLDLDSLDLDDDLDDLDLDGLDLDALGIRSGKDEE